MPDLTILTPDDVETRLNRLGIHTAFSAAEREHYKTSPIVNSMGACLAFPTPADNARLNILSIREICGTNPQHQPALFDHPWYLEEPFASARCHAGWHVIQRHTPEDTIGATADHYTDSNKSGIQLPSAVEVTLMLFLNYVGTGEQLLHKKHTWCSDVTTLGNFVTVGAFGRNGLFVSGHPGSFSSRGLGICAKFKC
jgi:hypothetical protein